MNDDKMLSQEEIDALLNGAEEKKTDQEAPVELNHFLSEKEKDALGEIGNISFGTAATTLSTLLNQKVEITTPKLSVVHSSRLEEEFPHPHVAVFVHFTAGFEGHNVLVIRENDARIIADLMLGGDGKNPAQEIGDMQLSAVQEAMNQMMGTAATSMSSIFDKRVDISPPSIDLIDVKQKKGTEKIPEEDLLIKVSFRLTVGDLIDSTIMQLLPVEFSKKMVQELLAPPDNKENSNKNQAGKTNGLTNHADKAQKESERKKEEVQRAEQHSGKVERTKPDPHTDVQRAVFSEFSNSPNNDAADATNLEMLYEIPLDVTVELGRTKRKVRDILNLSQGSVIELDKLAGEPVDIYVNRKLIARGEVVVIDENFGVRVTEIASAKERIDKLT